MIEVPPDGFGFMRSPQSNYLAGPDDMLRLAPADPQIWACAPATPWRQIRGPRDGERYFALVRVSTVNFEDPERARHKVPFDNLTPLYPDERLTGARGSDQEGSLGPRDRYRLADRQGSAGAHRCAAAHRQDRAAAEHRAVRR